MRPAPFAYTAPRATTEVVELLIQHGVDARVLAGGQSLVPLLNLRMIRPAVLIDLNFCNELDYIENRGNYIAVGPMTRQLAAMKSLVLRKHCPLVCEALQWTGPVAVRARSTVGGTLAHADRVAELPAAAVALGATMVIEGRKGKREVAATEFFLGDLTTAIQPNEFLREIHVPVCLEGSFSRFSEVSVRQEGVAVVGVAVHLTHGAGKVRTASLVAMGVDAAPVRLRGAEAELLRAGLESAAIETIAGMASDEVEPPSDIYTSAAYRKHVVGALLKKALHEARVEAR